MEKKLHVIIAGQANTGKSTLAEWLEYELDRIDIPSEVIDDSPDPQPSGFPERLEVLTNAAHVTIEVVQTHRGKDRLDIPAQPWNRGSVEGMAQELIDEDNHLCRDVAIHWGQDYENVKHMRWFRYAVMTAIALDGEKAPQASTEPT